MQDNTEDMLNKFVESNDHKPAEQPKNVEYIGSNVRQKVDKIEADSDYLNILLTDLPHGIFYHDGVKISIRPLKTKEIQSFAVVDERNPYDVMVKLNELLSACVKIENIVTKEPMAYTDIFDGDRDTIILIIAKASAKFGRKIEKLVKCACGIENKLELIPMNYVYKKHSPDIEPWFNPSTKRYELRLKSGAAIDLAPPTIGLVQDINNYMLVKATKSQGKDTPNITFMQTVPYIKAGKGVKNMTFEQMEQEEYNFQHMNDELFMFTYEAIDMISFGIEECKSTCKCGREVKAKFGFPNGARALFIIPNSFRELIGQ